MKSILFIILAVGALIWIRIERLQAPAAQVVPNEATPATESVIQPAVPSLPDRAVIANVPFIPQAPLKKWDSLHEDACEEASLLTLRYWLAGRQPEAAEIERELQSFIYWQNDQGFGPSITLTDLKRAAAGYWSQPWWSKITVVQDASLDDLRRELAAGRPVVIGAAGRELKNPHFKNGGPNYHMLVLTGYEGDEFVTNDPGTQFGAGYRYSAEVIAAAWHDWNPTDILRGGRDYLVAK